MLHQKNFYQEVYPPPPLGDFCVRHWVPSQAIRKLFLPKIKAIRKFSRKAKAIRNFLRVAKRYLQIFQILGVSLSTRDRDNIKNFCAGLRPAKIYKNNNQKILFLSKNIKILS